MLSLMFDDLLGRDQLRELTHPSIILFFHCFFEVNSFKFLSSKFLR